MKEIFYLKRKSLNTKKGEARHDIGIPGPGLGQAQKCGGFKPITVIQ
jgi:hypothetical protein